MTPCKSLGYKEGDLFIVTRESDWFKLGSTVQLIWDDSTKCPQFKDLSSPPFSGNGVWFEHLDNVAPYKLNLENE